VLSQTRGIEDQDTVGLARTHAYVTATSSLPLAEWEDLWQQHSPMFIEAVGRGGAVSGRASFEDELLFCLLGGYGISYEHAASAAIVIKPLQVFGGNWTNDELAARLADELSNPQFGPPRSNGQPRRYRFPVRKADLLVQARGWYLELGDPVDRLDSLRSEGDRRLLLCGCPGIGPKTASWILRNIGLATRLAIIDIHVCRVMSHCGLIDRVQLPRDYGVAEDAFLKWCDRLAAPPDAFDLFLWECQRMLRGLQ